VKKRQTFPVPRRSRKRTESSEGSNRSEPIFTFRKKLSEFFPPDHPDSTWLLRLTVLRDDFAYEVERLGLKRDDPPGEVWRCAYTLRKIGITIREIKNIFCHELQHMLSKRAATLPPPLVDEIKRAIVAVEEADVMLEPIRNAMGAHVRPRNASQVPNYDPTPDILRAHGESPFEVCVDMGTGRATSFRTLTAAAFLFAWPDVVSEDDYFRKHAALADKLYGCLASTIHTIDGLLYVRWAGDWDSLSVPFASRSPAR